MKVLADDILNLFFIFFYLFYLFFFYFFIYLFIFFFFHIFAKHRFLYFLQTVSNGDNLQECQILFSRKNKKHIIKLPSAELGQRVVKVKANSYIRRQL